MTFEDADIDSIKVDRLRWLTEPHANVEFGEPRIYSRLADFLASNISAAVMRLPLDLLIWLLIFYLGHRFGAMFFG